MADWSLPTLSSTYTNFLSNLTARDTDAATQFSVGTPTNVPTGAIQWSTSLNRWQKWSGTAWGELAATYALTGVTCTSLNNTGNTTLGDASADTVTVNAATWSFVNVTSVSGTVNFTGTLQYGGVAVITMSSTTTLTNKTIDTAGPNTIKVNGNTLAATAGTATITFPNTTDTLVARTTTDTMTNKTLQGATINTSSTIAGSSINADNTITDTGTIGTTAPGFRGIPQNSQTAAYTLALTDNGKHISTTTGGITIPANASIAFPVGATIAVFNNSASTQSLAITTDTLRQAGTTNTGARTIAAYGLITLVKVAATVWVVSGNIS